MAKKEDHKLSLASVDLTDELLTQLRETIPQVFTEGKVDFDKLKSALGGSVAMDPERYGLSWAGKSDAFRNVQSSSVGTLHPRVDQSVDWDNTENLIVEGDNLEVLKLLQKAYHNRVKMIYIDPPYNTNNEFIYLDSYRDGLKNYLEYTQQIDEEGNRTSTNSESSGRYHSNWLNMMYPRLFLARNLLKEDGVIFVSIDDREVHNLRLLMDEVFGGENFVANVIWQKKYAVSNDDPGIGSMHDSILVYQRSESFQRNLLPRTEKQTSRYTNLDNDSRGAWSSDNYVSNKSKSERPTLWYPLTHPKTGEDVWPEESAVWRYSCQKHSQMERENRLYWGPDLSYKRPRLKRFLSEVQDGVVPSTWWAFQDVGHNDEGQKETAKLLGPKVFSTPKPVRLLNRIIEIGMNKNDVVLDFFAGSGATAHAILDSNKKDNGNRKFILVQLPEKTDLDEYPTIAHITRERVRRVIEKFNAEDEEALDLQAKQDRGFRAFKLTESNFKIWDAEQTPETPDELAAQLTMYSSNVERLKDMRGILYELILKSGLPLESKVAAVEVTGQAAWMVNEGELLICLEQPITKEMIREMIAMKPERMLCLDVAFDGCDELKTNTVLEAQSHGIVFKTV